MLGIPKEALPVQEWQAKNFIHGIGAFFGCHRNIYQFPLFSGLGMIEIFHCLLNSIKYWEIDTR